MLSTPPTGGKERRPGENEVELAVHRVDMCYRDCDAGPMGSLCLEGSSTLYDTAEAICAEILELLRDSSMGGSGVTPLELSAGDAQRESEWTEHDVEEDQVGVCTRSEPRRWPGP